MLISVSDQGPDDLISTTSGGLCLLRLSHGTYLALHASFRPVAAERRRARVWLRKTTPICTVYNSLALLFLSIHCVESSQEQLTYIPSLLLVTEYWQTLVLPRLLPVYPQLTKVVWNPLFISLEFPDLRTPGRPSNMVTVT